MTGGAIAEETELPDSRRCMTSSAWSVTASMPACSACCASGDSPAVGSTDPLMCSPHSHRSPGVTGGALKRFSTWLVFDYDGTLRTELPMYAQLAFALDLAAELGHPTSLPELQVGGCLPWPSW